MYFTRIFTTRSEFNRLWAAAKQPHLRAGQSFWNAWGTQNLSFPELFYETNEEKAKEIAWQKIMEDWKQYTFKGTL